jgi:hypothetical protein
MRFTRIALVGALLAGVSALPAMAQSKAQIAKSALDFQTQVVALSNNLAGLNKRISTSSPNDKEMLKLATSQLGIVDANANAVLVLGALAGEMKDAGDLAAAKKYLISSCKTLKGQAESSADYVGTLASNIAAPATAAEVGKAKELLGNIAQHALCAAK